MINGLLNPANGLTVTFKVCVLVQPLIVKVTWYWTTIELKVVLTNVSLIAPLPEAAAFEIPATVARVQVYITLFVFELGE